MGQEDISQVTEDAMDAPSMPLLIFGPTLCLIKAQEPC